LLLFLHKFNRRFFNLVRYIIGPITVKEREEFISYYKDNRDLVYKYLLNNHHNFRSVWLQKHCVL